MNAVNLSVFPTDSPMFDSLYSFYDLNKPIAFALVGSLLMIRTIYLAMSGLGSDSYFELIRDVFLTMIVLIGFTTFVRSLGEIPKLMIEHLGTLHQSEINIASKNEGWVLSLNEFSDWITFIVSILSGVFYFIVLGIVCVIGPFIILFSFMFNQIWLFLLLVGCLLIMSFWPILWYLINLIIIHEASQDLGWMNIIVVILGTLAKVAMPIGLLKLMATKSGVASGKAHLDSGFAQTKMVMATTANLGVQAIKAMGGGTHLNQLNESLQNQKKKVSDFASDNAKKVIPGAVSTIANVGKFAKNQIGDFSRNQGIANDLNQNLPAKTDKNSIMLNESKLNENTNDALIKSDSAKRSTPINTQVDLGVKTSSSMPFSSGNAVQNKSSLSYPIKTGSGSTVNPKSQIANHFIQPQNGSKSGSVQSQNNMNSKTVFGDSYRSPAQNKSNFKNSGIENSQIAPKTFKDKGSKNDLTI